jgi:DNA-binding IclR family transcriptional regulator
MALLLGGSLPLHVGAAPQILLAYELHEFWEEYVVRRNLSAMTARSMTTKEALFASLERIRSDGHAISDRDVVEGIATVGAPIFAHQGELCAASSMGGAGPTILGEHRAKSIRAVVEGAKKISRTLGHSHE